MTLMRTLLKESKGRKVTRVVYGSGNGHRENVGDMAGGKSARLGKREIFSCGTRKNKNSNMAYIVG